MKKIILRFVDGLLCLVLFCMLLWLAGFWWTQGARAANGRDVMAPNNEVNIINIGSGYGPAD